MQGLHTALASFGVAVQGLQNAQGGFLFDGTDFGGYVCVETNLLQASVALFADLVHGEAAFGGEVFKRDAALGVLPEVFA